jgi:glycine C-acetyltransferase
LRRRRSDPAVDPAAETTLDRSFLDRLATQCAELRTQGLYKPERVLGSPQQPVVKLDDGRELINLCANNYLALANHPALREAAHRAIDRYGYGMASVRFICGTHAIHKELEQRLAAFVGQQDAILYSSCFDANGGLFETLLDEQDAVISDALNHASIIDGIRLCKARRLRYANSDLGELETRLKEAAGARVKLIATDGVFSMDGTIARLHEIADLAERYGALLMVDDSHATGFIGAGGRGTPEYHRVTDRVDIITGTLGKALGGAAGGFTAARREIVEWLRQRSRPYLFSNSLPPVIAAASVRALDLIEQGNELREQLRTNAARFRAAMSTVGFTLPPGEHPIIPVMLGDATLAARFAERLLEHGVYAIGFSFPVVPQEKARIRTQMCAGHTPEQVDRAVTAFTAVGRELGVIN